MNEAAQLQRIQTLAANGALDDALKACSAAVRTQPKNLEFLYLKATLHGMRGETEQARQYFRRVLKHAPNHAVTHHALGSVLQSEGRLQEAVQCFRKAVQLQPDFTKARNDLGVANQLLGRLDEAAASYRAVLAQQPGHALTWYNLGCVLQQQDNPGEAERCLREALRLKPDFAEAHNSLGITLQATDRTTEAETHYQSALRIRPGYLDALLNLGGLLTSEPYRPEEAARCFESALATDPNNAKGHYGLGNALRECGHIEKALASYQRCLALDPGNQDAIAKIAGVKERQGDYQGAFALLEPLLQDTRNSEIAIAFAAIARYLERETEAISLLERLLDDSGMSEVQKMNLHFALGELYNRQAGYAQAFNHFSAGNQQKGMVFDADEYSRIIDSIITTYSADKLPELAQGNPVSRQPVFIVGMPRSGTTLTEQILSGHPQLQAAGELNEINAFAVRMHERLPADKPYPACAASLTRRHIEHFVHDYLEALPVEGKARPVFTDKLPHNFLHLGLIQQLFPNARIVHCVRDPRATCLSCYFLDFHGLHPYAYDLTSLGRYYKLYERLMAHWQTVLDLPIHTLHYEHLVTDQAQETRRLLEFCGLDWDERCLDFHRSQRYANTASYAQVRQPLYRSALEHWKHYEPWLGPLMEALESENKGP